MFDCETFIHPINFADNKIAVEDMRLITCRVNCCRCNKEIITWWDEKSNTLEGRFIAIECELSEVFGQNLPLIGTICCEECIVFSKGK